MMFRALKHKTRMRKVAEIGFPLFVVCFFVFFFFKLEEEQARKDLECWFQPLRGWLWKWSQACLTCTVQEAVNTIWSKGNSSWIHGRWDLNFFFFTISLQWGYLDTGAGAQRDCWFTLLGDTQNLTVQVERPLFEQGFEPRDLQRSLPAWVICWLYDLSLDTSFM